METRRPTKTKVLPGALAGIVTIAVLGVFSSAAPFLTDGTALAAHSGLSPGGDPDEGNPTPTPSPTATPTLTPAPTPTPAPPSGWSIVSSPSPVSAQLNAVAAVSANDVWAVGTAGPSTLAEHWNGSRWDIVPTPNRAGSGATQLLGVAAVSANDVWAVGFSDTPYATLAEHWNGSSWSIIPTPNPPVPPYEFSLNAVAAISANDIWAVGGRGYNGHALLEHWDGSTWSIVAAPPSTATWFASSRFGLAAVASNNVWAVGNYDSFHWDGTTWSVVLGAQNTGAASAAGAAGVWAVGTYVDNYYYYYATYTLAYLWNGSSWVQTSTVTPTFLDTFQGVSARASNDVWAVGTTSRTLTLTEHWDGSSWKVEPSPNASTAPNAYHVLRAVVAIASNDAWSVGYYFDGAGNQLTLIEHYAG